MSILQNSRADTLPDLACHVVLFDMPCGTVWHAMWYCLAYHVVLFGMPWYCLTNAHNESSLVLLSTPNASLCRDSDSRDSVSMQSGTVAATWQPLRTEVGMQKEDAFVQTRERLNVCCLAHVMLA